MHNLAHTVKFLKIRETFRSFCFNDLTVLYECLYMLNKIYNVYLRKLKPIEFIHLKKQVYIH